jgi:DNA-binding transcriptional MerR regulator
VASVLQVAGISLRGQDWGVEEPLTVAAVARRIGVAPATLRTWDRRYGLGPSGHVEGSHRRYSKADVAKLVTMRRLITSGVAPSDAANRAKSFEGEYSVNALVSEIEIAEDLVQAICRAAETLDREFIIRALRQEVMKNGVIQCWQSIIVPVLTIVGSNWEATGDGIEIEHMLTELIKSVMRDSIPEDFNSINARPVLLACVGEEMHSLPLHALAAALAERDISTNFLGARTPLSALCGIVNRSAPPALFLWAQLPENGDPKYFEELPDVRPAPKIVLGGPGWNPQQCSEVAFVQDLQHACEEITQAIGA